MARYSFSLMGATLHGVDAVPVTVELVISSGVPAFGIIGMPDTAIQESRERVRAAIRACGFVMPRDKIVVNLAPASVRKRGTGFDLPIAVALLAATGQIDPSFVRNLLVVGELSLQGEVSSVNGLLSYQLLARELGLNLLTGSVVEGVIPVEGVRCLSVATLAQLKQESLQEASHQRITRPKCTHDFSEVCGQEFAKRALQVAATGNHGVLMMGPPGSGKSLLARCLPSIMPDLTEEEKLSAAILHSVVGEPTEGILAGSRPFRSPHHSASAAGLVGGGHPVRPGEISLAHRGVLFLDELAEFKPAVLQELRQPLEEGIIRLTRVDGTYEFPSRFLLLAASNPCPCGHYGDPEHACTCSEYQVRSYQNRIGGPLMDRIDIRIDVWRAQAGQLMGGSTGVGSAELREGVVRGRAFAEHRRRSVRLDESAGIDAMLAHCKMSVGTRQYFEGMANAHQMSARSVLRCLRLSRTIADIAEEECVSVRHLAEASVLRFDSGLIEPGGKIAS